MTINKADRFLKSKYIDMVNKELKNPNPNLSRPVRCRDCGRSNVILRKCSDGFYICNDCLRKGEMR